MPVCQSVQTVVLRDWEDRFEIWTGKAIWLDPEDERAHQEMDLLITTMAGPKALKLDLLSLKESVNVARGDGFPNLLAMASFWRKNGKNAMPFWGYWRIWCHECDYFANDPVLFTRQPADAARRRPLVELPQCGGGGK